MRYSKVLQMRAEPMKLPEEDVGRALEDTGRGTGLVHVTLVAQKIMPITNKCDFMKLKSIFMANN